MVSSRKRWPVGGAGWLARFRRPALLGLALLLLLVPAGAGADDGPGGTQETPAKAGGYISFETVPSDAEIWLDGKKIGTSPFLHPTEAAGTMDVLVRKRLFEDYRGTVTVRDGERVWFLARLIPLPSQLPAQDIPAVVVTTATVPAGDFSVTVPTPWPSPPQSSPAGPAAALGAAAFCIAFSANRRR